MYPVSEAYKQAIRENSRKFYYAGKIVTAGGVEYPFTNADIVKGSGYVSAQCCGDAEIELGCVYAAELGISLFLDVDRYTLMDGQIAISFYLQLADGTYEAVPLGIFDISEATRNRKTLTIKAYDRMLRFEKNSEGVVSSGTAYQFLAIACEECGVELGHTEDEIAQWPNGSELLGVYPENDIETWRDILYYVAQAMGRFCTIDRSGRLVLRPYGTESVCNLEAKHRYSSTFSDFVTRYTAISSTNRRTETAEYIALEQDNGLTMNLGVNPFLQFGLDATRKRMLDSILTAVSQINYLPFDSTTIGNPAFDLGDVITFSGGHADGEQITCITKYEYRVNGKHTLKCVGKDPRLASAKSKNDKNITGLLNQIEAGRIAIYRYMNAAPYEIGPEDSEICSIEFASSEDTEAQFHGSILLEVTADPIQRSCRSSVTVPKITLKQKPAPVEGYTCPDIEVTTEEKEIAMNWLEEGKATITVTYIWNEYAVSHYHPVESFGTGKHILNLYYPIDEVKGNSLHTFRVRLKITGGTAYIGTTQEICTISGQGLSANSAWDGRLEFSEELDLLPLGQGILHPALHDDMVVKTQKPIPSFIGEDFQIFGFGGGIRLPDFEALPVSNEVIQQQTLVFRGSVYTQYADDKYTLRRAYRYDAHDQLVDIGYMKNAAVQTSDKAAVSEMEVIVDGKL